jgi:AcrR family transcriptional regulator
LSPRPYQMAQRKAAGDETRDRILAAARELLLAEDFSDFTMEAVARSADVSRLTIYYQFDSKAKLLEALYDYIARRGRMDQLAEVFRTGNDAVSLLHNFIRVFAVFWASDRNVIRRLHGLGTIDAEIGRGLRARNERRRQGLKVVVDLYSHKYLPFTPVEEPIVIDSLHMITSFETFDALAVSGRKFEEVVEILKKMANGVVGFQPRFIPPRYK